MINERSLDNLYQHHEKTRKWEHGKTRTIRVPVILADKILDYAKQLDRGACEFQEVAQELQRMIDKIEAKEKGYKPNSATQLINDLQVLLERL